MYSLDDLVTMFEAFSYCFMFVISLLTAGVWTLVFIQFLSGGGR